MKLYIAGNYYFDDPYMAPYNDVFGIATTEKLAIDLIKQKIVEECDSNIQHLFKKNKEYTEWFEKLQYEKGLTGDPPSGHEYHDIDKYPSGHLSFRCQVEPCLSEAVTILKNFILAISNTESIEEIKLLFSKVSIGRNCDFHVGTIQNGLYLREVDTNCLLPELHIEKQ